jgi:hypothetical protein
LIFNGCDLLPNDLTNNQSPGMKVGDIEEPETLTVLNLRMTGILALPE